MSLRTTLRRLEQLAAVPMLAPRCAGCGYPSRTSAGVLILDSAATLEHCPLCDQALDEHGRALGGMSLQGMPMRGIILYGVESPT